MDGKVQRQIGKAAFKRWFLAGAAGMCGQHGLHTERIRSVPPENAAQGLLLCKIKVRTGGIGAPNMVQ